LALQSGEVCFCTSELCNLNSSTAAASGLVPTSLLTYLLSLLAVVSLYNKLA
jgi:hypothetical protein